MTSHLNGDTLTAYKRLRNVRLPHDHFHPSAISTLPLYDVRPLVP